MSKPSSSSTGADSHMSMHVSETQYKHHHNGNLPMQLTDFSAIKIENSFQYFWLKY